MGKAPYDPVKDFAPISIVGTNPYVLPIHPDIPATNLAEFIDYVRRRPDQINYAAPVFGGLSHLNDGLVPQARRDRNGPGRAYKGGAAPMSDLIGGHVPAFFTLLSDVLPHVSAGSVRLLARVERTARRRNPDRSHPDRIRIPRIRGAHLERREGPGRNSKAIVDRLAQEVSRGRT
jgi:tripartite-type tricarboxylate transporter receptor subunit TctC